MSEPETHVSEPEAHVSEPDAHVSEPEAHVSEPEADVRGELPRATIHGAPARFRIRPKHAVLLFALLSIAGVFRGLLILFLYFPPAALAWLVPVLIPLFRKRVGPVAATLCLVAFLVQGFVFEIFDVYARFNELDPGEMVSVVAITAGIIASVIGMFRSDPDPDFVPNEFTIR